MRVSTKLARFAPILERLIQANRETDGSFDIKSGSDVHLQFAKHLEEHEEPRNYLAEALVILQRYDEAQRPHVEDEQQTLFEPNAWIPLDEDGLRMPMGDAKAQHLDQWREVTDEENYRHQRAYVKKREYINTRRRAIRANETLKALEERAFGWQDPHTLPTNGRNPKHPSISRKDRESEGVAE